MVFSSNPAVEQNVVSSLLLIDIVGIILVFLISFFSKTNIFSALYFFGINILVLLFGILNKTTNFGTVMIMVLCNVSLQSLFIMAGGVLLKRRPVNRDWEEKSFFRKTFEVVSLVVLNIVIIWGVITTMYQSH